MIDPHMVLRRLAPIVFSVLTLAPCHATADPKAAKTPQAQAQDYCASIGNAAADARFAWQSKRLAELEAQLKQRIAELDAKRTEYRDWVEKRTEILKRANIAMVGIYSHMDPEAAAAQLGAMDDQTAAAILAQVSPRAASSILNEMPPDRAARVANAIAGSKPPAGDEKKS